MRGKQLDTISRLVVLAAVAMALVSVPCAWAQDAQEPRQPAQPRQPASPRPVQSRPKQAPPPMPKQVTTAPVPARPAGMSSQDQELVRMVQLQVEQQIEQIRTGRARQRERAQQTIFQLHHQLLIPLDAGRNKGVSIRDANRILAGWLREIQIARLGIELGPDAMVRVNKLRAARPDIVERLASDNPQTQAQGLDLLAKWDDPDQLAEPLVLRTLRGTRSEHLLRAVNLFRQNRYLSPEALNGLLRMYDDPAQVNFRTQIIQVLDKFEDGRLPPILLQGLLNYRYITLAAPAADGLVKHNALGAVPVLIDNLRDDAPTSPGGQFNGIPVTYSQNDTLLYAVLKLTGQPFDEYGLRTHVVNGRVMATGFTDDQARREAVKKLQTWWAENRDKPPYDKIEAIATEPATK